MNGIELTNMLYRKTKRSCVKKHSLKTDMTPMVDLGFLLITFFVFTAEMTNPTTIDLYMPHDGPSMLAPESKSMTILIGNKEKLFYYFGRENDISKNQFIHPVSYSEIDGIGSIIREKQEQLGANKRELVVLIKAGNGAGYKKIVNILDEMTINGVKKYALLKPDELETKYMEQKNLTNDLKKN